MIHNKEPTVVHFTPLDEVLDAFQQNIENSFSEVKELIKQNREPESLLTIKEACLFLKISSPTLLKYRKKGHITAYFIGRSPRFKKSELLEFKGNPSYRMR